MKPFFCRLHRLPASIALFALVVLLVSCSAPGQASPGAEGAMGCERLLTVSLGNGYTRTKTTLDIMMIGNADNTMDAILHLSIYAGLQKNQLMEPNKGYHIETLHSGSTDFSVWDALDDYRYIVWESGGNTYFLSIQAQQETARLGATTPETAQILEKNPTAAIAGYTVQDISWMTFFKNKNSVAYIALQSPDFYFRSMAMVEQGKWQKVKDGDVMYYTRRGDNYNKTMKWFTDIGTVTVNVGANNVDDVNLFNSGLFNSINAQLGAKIFSLPEATDSPNP